MKILEFDVIFLSYDEPNADLHYGDLSNTVPWAQRVHGVKGSDHAHKAAAELSQTEWFITVDADNVVHPEFFNIDLDMSDENIKVYGWCGKNTLNGLRYGNGGLKIWNKQFVLDMKTHENANTDRAQVDFCWEDGYRNFPRSYSKSIFNATPYQAWRAGFREGVKMTLFDGVKVPAWEIRDRIWWHNIHRLRMWSTVGSHDENGLFAVMGARLGSWMANCTDWDYIEVRDFEILKNIYDENVKCYETDASGLVEFTKELGQKIKSSLGLDWPYLDPVHSKNTLDLYEETMKLNDTYFQTPVPIDV